jgi:hypothetical protein
MSCERRYFVGLELGLAPGYSAAVVLEQTLALGPQAAGQWTYAVRHAERFPPGASYPAVCAHVGAWFAAPPVAGATLAVDQTAVGRPVVDLLRGLPLRARLVPVTLTAGHRASPAAGGGWLLPRQEAIATLQVLLQARRLQVAPLMPHAAALARELEAFRTRSPDAGRDPSAAGQDGEHADLVLALALAAWAAERLQPPGQPAAGTQRSPAYYYQPR